MIPVNFLIDVTVKFTKFMYKIKIYSRDLKSYDEIKDVFKLPSNSIQITRKEAQNLENNPKKRMQYANIPLN